jgi:hypothetical protein
VTSGPRCIQSDASQADRRCTFRISVGSEFLSAAGLDSLSDEIGADLTNAFISEHERRICNSVLDRLSPDEMRYVSSLFDADDGDGVNEWFEYHDINVPLVTRRHYETLVDELKSNKERILAALDATGTGKEGTIH